MTAYGNNLNTDLDGVRTSGEYGNDGGGTTRWHQWMRAADGGIAGLGALADAAETDATAAASLIALVKGLVTTVSTVNTTAASADGGVAPLAVRKDTQAALADDGEYTQLQTDADGALRVAGTVTTTSAAVSATNATTSALASSLVVKASAGNLKGFQGYSTAAQFIQVHDASSLPADTAVPVLVIPVEADKPFSIDLGSLGREFTTGIVICNSSTGPTKTIGSADTWIDAQYI